MDGNIEHRFYVGKALSAGFHVAGIDIGVSCGSPAGVKAFQQFYETVVKEWQLYPQARLFAQSNGGLMHYNWAARYPSGVERILGIFPATDLRSWPGLKRACDPSFHGGAGYDFPSAELEARLMEFSPIEHLESLAIRRVKVLHLHGNNDTVVPLEPNSVELIERYRALGGDAELIITEGEGHTPGPKF